MSVVTLTVGALACALALAMALSASQAQGAPKVVLSCGAQVTSSVTLTSNIGPCPSSADGLDVVASGITVNLNGHSITGTNSTNNTLSEPVGIGLMNVHNVTITGPGMVSHFDAGIAINGGYDNTIKNLAADNNVAHVLFAGGVDPGNPIATPCDNGDGILTNNSNGNLITNVGATGNGPFDGIALVGSSSYNKVLNSHSYDNNVANIVLSGTSEGQPGPCGPFGAATVGQGRPHQDIGIRIEGPGATNNIVANNTSTGNMLEGISIHGNVCPGNAAGVPSGDPNIDNLVKNNIVEHNGFADVTDGIGVLSQGPAGIVCVAYDNTITGNTSDYNARDGIFMGGRGSHNNTVTYNTTDFNGKDGIELTGPTPPSDTLPNGLPGSINNVLHNNEAHGNATFDAADGNAGCDNNMWSNDIFTTVNQSCVK